LKSLKSLKTLLLATTGLVLFAGCSNTTGTTVQHTQAYYKHKQAYKKAQAQRAQKKRVRVSPHAGFVNEEGGYCKYNEKTIHIALRPNGTGEFVACQNHEIKRHGVVSAGRPGTHDTVRGTFRTQWKAHKWDSKKYPSEDGGYNMLRAQFFHGGFALHNGNVNGLSHGCVRTQMSNADWLYKWSPIGTKIIIE